MERVKELLAAGLSFPAALKQALTEKGVSVSGLADTHGIARSVASEVINLDRFPRLTVAGAIAAELGGTAFEWQQLMWEHAKPVKAAV
jgi:hypothetical protein